MSYFMITLFCYKKTLQPVLIILLYFNSIHIKISWNSQLKIKKATREKDIISREGNPGFH